eukprot:6608108-Pyramimonas_sp.AAC.1
MAGTCGGLRAAGGGVRVAKGELRSIIGGTRDELRAARKGSGSTTGSSLSSPVPVRCLGLTAAHSS